MTPPAGGNPERPAWAERTLSALRDATLYGYGDGRLTDTEQTLIRAVMYRLSHRIGERNEELSTDLHTLGTGIIRLAAEEIAAEETLTAAREVTP
ncbi:hypothetical protein NE235_10850 [Actinoallomurus spadix]|nr:hypothetical protein [Actinoallomurus spadix]